MHEHSLTLDNSLFPCNALVQILDETTSALDTKSEAIMQQTQGQLSTSRNTLATAHRPSTTCNADFIEVVYQELVGNQGSHHELLTQGGIYAGLHLLQFSQSEAEKDV